MWEQGNQVANNLNNAEAQLPTNHSEIVKEIKDIDFSLKNDYKCYLGWLWFDFFLNILWSVNLFFIFFGAGSEVYSVWVSIPTTALILITLAYGISGFNAKDGARQYKFGVLLKILIVVFVVNAVVLLATSSMTMLLGRLVTIGVSFALLYYGRNLERVFKRRRQLLEQMDRLSVDARYGA